MGLYNLDNFFDPASIAVIGASDRINSVGMKVFKNIFKNNFAGNLYAVNPEHHQVQGQPCVPTVKAIDQSIDLAIITTPAVTVPDIMAECGEKGIRSVVIISAGFGEIGSEGKALETSLLEIAQRYQIRIIGPNCLGIMRPKINLNATIITNGGGAGVMAADRASELNIVLPKLDDNTITQFSKSLPQNWSHQNPIDILGDATPERYHAVIDVCSKDTNSDALLTILVPVAMSQPLKVAEQIVADANKNNKPLLACWMGEHQVKSSRKLFAKHKVPNFDTPEKAIEAFSYLANYEKNQKLLLQVPSQDSFELKADTASTNLIIDAALAENRKILTTLESKKILKVYGIPVNEVIAAASADESVKAAEHLGYPVVMKINSPDISHKQDVDGVQLNIVNAEAVRITFDKIIKNAKNHCPKAKILGVTVEKMCKTPSDRELMIGIISDKVFGPVISFGLGGGLVEIVKDQAIELPPLNQFLAEQLIARTRASKILSEFRNKPAVSMDVLINILLRISEMICELPRIKEMDINPLIINEHGAMAIDARFVIESQPSNISAPYSHMAIHPYPNNLVSTSQTQQ